MDKDDIIRMAVEAGSKQINDYYTNGAVKSFSPVTLERFANLVAAAEREACAKLCESRGTFGTGSVEILAGAAYAIRARGQS